MYVFEPLLLGLSTGPFCFGYCAPMLIPFLVSEQRRFMRTMQLLSLFFVGRLTGYLMIGLFSGVIGSSIAARHVQDFASIANIGMGLLLLMFGLVQNFPKLDTCKIFRFEKSSAFSILALGLLTGINLCPPFIAAITRAVGTGTILNAVGYFLFFFLGTSLVLVPIWVTGVFARFQDLRNVARVCVLLSGIWLSIKGIGMLMYITN
jgi:sulfite exporter TauE/SafE